MAVYFRVRNRLRYFWKVSYLPKPLPETVVYFRIFIFIFISFILLAHKLMLYWTWTMYEQRSIDAPFCRRFENFNEVSREPSRDGFLARGPGEITWSLTRQFSISFTLINCQRCLKSENKKKYWRSFHVFLTILQQIMHVHAMRSLRHSCLLQASINREQLWHRLYWTLVILIAIKCDYKP